jgi:hypothetical protein
MATRTLEVDVLTRVEGEGALTLVLDGERVVDAKLRIFEPPRLFEAMLRGARGDGDPGPHGAHLRHLPRRLPDERVQRGGGRARRAR